MIHRMYPSLGDPTAKPVLDHGTLAEASELLDEVIKWQTPCESSPLHPRAQTGNLSYKYALVILLLRNIFRVPLNHTQVSKAIDAIIELGQEVLAMSARVIWMTWPMKTACLHMHPDDPRAETARTILAEYA